MSSPTRPLEPQQNRRPRGAHHPRADDTTTGVCCPRPLCSTEQHHDPGQRPRVWATSARRGYRADRRDRPRRRSGRRPLNHRPADGQVPHQPARLAQSPMARATEALGVAATAGQDGPARPWSPPGCQPRKRESQVPPAFCSGTAWSCSWCSAGLRGLAFGGDGPLLAVVAQVRVGVTRGAPPGGLDGLHPTSAQPAATKAYWTRSIPQGPRSEERDGPAHPEAGSALPVPIGWPRPLLHEVTERHAARRMRC